MPRRLRPRTRSVGREVLDDGGVYGIKELRQHWPEREGREIRPIALARLSDGLVLWREASCATSERPPGATHGAREGASESERSGPLRAFAMMRSSVGSMFSLR